ncbi:uncharacterized protein HRG_06258 [Hirsutella rhossiliensis]|uniref:Uncharacterized protein n=1 Tax=Hirsutella rhossiliensis TaxID=111463 RepID=A0A9P8MX79_9HYPO|nr:uncharacterized protein HRG_06258 [Hirsutella rhossiliensis]KAH0963748.1 hypothetical protein HRG_06258 [Hirsutella rhossiliensis]
MFLAEFEGHELDETPVPDYDTADEIDDEDPAIGSLFFTQSFLANYAVLHRLTKEDAYSAPQKAPAQQFLVDDRYTTRYQGIMLDTVRKWGHAWFHLARLHRLLRCAGHDDIDEQFTLRDDREFNFEITADRSKAPGRCLSKPNSIGKVEKAHGPLRRAYDILQAELGESRSPDALLQMAVKAVNDTAGPDGLVPTLLVFGAYPRINHDSPPSPPMIKRAEAIRKAMAALHRAAAARQVRDALNTRNGPNVSALQSFPAERGPRVERADGWTGPWIVIGNNGHEITINHVNGPATSGSQRSRNTTVILRPLITTPRRLAAVPDESTPMHLTPIKMMPLCSYLNNADEDAQRLKNKPKTGVANLSRRS